MQGWVSMKDQLILRLHLFVFLLSLLWVMLGAPVLRAEWQDIPHRLALMFTQLPGRISGIFALWR